MVSDGWLTSGVATRIECVGAMSTGIKTRSPRLALQVMLASLQKAPIRTISTSSFTREIWRRVLFVADANAATILP